MDGSHPAAWTLDEARTRFDELIARARTGEAQHITLEDGGMLLVSAKTVAKPRLTPIQALRMLEGSGAEFERAKGGPRPVFDDEA